MGGERAHRVGADAAVGIADKLPQEGGRLHPIELTGGRRLWSGWHRQAPHGPEPHIGGWILHELEQRRHRRRIARAHQRPRRAPAHAGVLRRGPAQHRREILAPGEPADRQQRLADDGRICRERRLQQIAGEGGARFRRLDLAERDRRLPRQHERGLRRRQQLRQPRHRRGVSQLARGEDHGRRDLRIGVCRAPPSRAEARRGSRSVRSPARPGAAPRDVTT